MTCVMRSRLFYLVVATVLFAQTVRADEVVLRNGKCLQGIVANREDVASNPEQYSYVSSLVEGNELVDRTQQLMRIPVNTVQYIVLIDGQFKRVVEFSRLAEEPEFRAHAPQYEMRNTRRRDAGIGLMILGGAIGAFGALVKFGGEKASATESSFHYDEDSYNAANYVLMVGGAVLFISGLVVATGPRRYTETSSRSILELEGREGRLCVRMGF